MLYNDEKYVAKNVKPLERRVMKIQKILVMSILMLVALPMYTKRHMKEADRKIDKKEITKKSKPASKKVKKKLPEKKVKKSTKKPKKLVHKSTYSPKRQARFSGFYNTFEYGFMKYNKDTSSLISVYDYTVNGNRSLPLNIQAGDATYARIEMDNTKWIPHFAYQAGLAFENLPMIQKDKKAHAHIGLATNVAKKRDAVEGSWFVKGATTTTLATLQDVKRFEGLVVGDYDLFKYYGITYIVDAAAGISVGGLRDIRVYEKSGSLLYDTGQRIPHKKLRFTGKFGFALEKTFDDVTLGFGYRVGFSKQKYEDYMLLEKPDPNASNSFKTNYDNLRAASAYKELRMIAPAFNITSYEFRFTAGWNF